MSEIYKTIADGYEQLAAAFRSLASATEDPQKKVDAEIDAVTDKAVLKELRKIKEAEVVENKKTGTKITRISAKDTKKKRR